MMCLHDIVNHGLKLSIIAILVLALGFFGNLEEQVAAEEADLHITTAPSQAV